MSRRHLDPSSSSWRDSRQRGYERDDDRGHDNDHHRPSAYAASKFRARPSSSATTPPWQRRRGGDSQWRETKQEEGLESTRYSQGGGDSADEGFGRYENEGPPEDGYRHERRVAPTARRHSSRSRSGSRDFSDGGVNNSPPDLEDDNRRDLEEGDEENCSEDGFVDDDEPGFIDDVDDDVEDDVDDGQPCCDDSLRSRHQTHHSYHRHHHHRRHRSRRDIGRRPSSRHRSRSRPRRHVAVESEDDEGGYDEEALEEQQNGGRSRRPDHRDREKEKAKRARRRDRDYARKMAAAQQAPLHMAMMQSMMGMRLGMIPPAAMAPTGPLAAGVPPPGFGGPRPPMMQMPPRMPQPRQANMPRPPRHRGPKPAADAGRTPRRSAKDAIEALIEDHNLSAGCAWMLRSLPPDRQKLAAKIDPSGRDDPSGFVAEQLRTII